MEGKTIESVEEGDWSVVLHFTDGTSVTIVAHGGDEVWIDVGKVV